MYRIFGKMQDGTAEDMVEKSIRERQIFHQCDLKMVVEKGRVTVP